MQSFLNKYFEIKLKLDLSSFVIIFSLVNFSLSVTPNIAVTHNIAMAAPNAVIKKFNPNSSKIDFSIETQIGQSIGKVQNIDGTIECQNIDCRENTKVNLKIPFSGLSFSALSSSGSNAESNSNNPFMVGDLSMIIQPLLMPFRQKTISLVGLIKKDPIAKFHPLLKFVGSATLDGKAEKINLPVKIQKSADNVVILADYTDEGDVEFPMGQLPINSSITSKMKLVFR